MVKNGLIRKLGIGITGLGILSSIYGCSEMKISKAEMLAGAGTAVAVLGETRGQVAAGLIAKTIGDSQVQKEIAEKGRDQITININPQDYQNNPIQQDSRLIPEYDLNQLRDQYIFGTRMEAANIWTGEKTLERREGLDCIFTCNKMLDLDANRNLDFKEFIGIKRNFKVGEEITYCVEVSGLARKPSFKELEKNVVVVNVNIFNEGGSKIYNKSYSHEFDNLKNSIPRVFVGKLNLNLPQGIYTIKCEYSDSFGDWIGRSRKYMSRDIGTVFQILE